MPIHSIRIGTRQSRLATVQAEIVRQQLLKAFPSLEVEIVPVVTTGDTITDRSLADIGGKGLFTKELEEGLLSGALDIAVHSLKDMETHLRPGMTIAAVLPRDDPRDALLAPQAKTLMQLPHGAKVGTSSARRTAQLKLLRPDLEIVPFRGNVTTRITKLKSGEVDATLLALAGLRRIGMEHDATEILGTERFIPAVGQGTIAIECKEDNAFMREMLQAIHHTPTHTAMLAERSLLAVLDGSCRTPIGGYAWLEGAALHLRAIVAKPDGSLHVSAAHVGTPAQAKELGEKVAHELLANGGKECLT